MARQLRLGLSRAGPSSRDDFIVSPANAEAVRMLDVWPAWHGGCLALVGAAGSGKTHLARAWAKAVKAAVITSPSAVSVVEVERLRGRPVLVEEADQGAPDETLFHLINMAGAPNGGVLFTARSAPSDWPTALPDLRSRLNALPVAQLGAPDDGLLAAVLLRFFRERSIEPADDVIPYLLRRIERSVPRAREIVERLDDAVDDEQRGVSRSLAKQILESEDEPHDLFD
ncbi:MAG TPA: chromosomal replication initiator DnaA [Caulobacteraceae bacterium]|nr:chromosomal replication initiator DnaA [Caulobacteraceae bacterium]